MFERRIVLSEQLPAAGRASDRVTPRGFFPAGQHIATDSVAEEVGRTIGSVLTPAGTGGAQCRHNVLFSQVEQRPKMHTAPAHPLHGSRRRQSRRSTPPSQAHEHALGDVILMMS